MLAQTTTGTIQGVVAHPVTVEANSGEKGEPKCVLVGLPDVAVRESMDRVFSSISNAGYSRPRTRVTINLAPADLRKEGASFDLPIALALLSSIGQFSSEGLNNYFIAGELALSGEVRYVKGALAMAILAEKMGKKGIILPKSSANEACLVKGINVFPVESLAEAVSFFTEDSNPTPISFEDSPHFSFAQNSYPFDFREVKGQVGMRRAIEIAVAGSHNAIFVGPPGSGKSMIAKRIPSIMPSPTIKEFLETLNIYSVDGQTRVIEKNGTGRPFRAPHHTISDAGLIGGGSHPKPGEISLAHNGILFLDELPEFKRSVLEVLRQPLEDGEVTISRSAGKITLPSRFMLVAAMNPCPCGYLGDPQHSCRCSLPQIQKYRSKISGPLLDRIDLHIEAPAVDIEQLQNSEKGESSEMIRKRVEKCRSIQAERLNQYGIYANAFLPDSIMEEVCFLGDENSALLKRAMKELSLSARAYGRILKVSRTIADLESSEVIRKQHLLEAIQYRTLDRFSLN